MPPRQSDLPEHPGDVPKESARAILFQFVVFPLGIVAIGVAIFLLFGKLASNEQSIPEYLTEIRSGSSHQRWQAAYQLSKALKRGEGKQVPNLVQQVEALYLGAKNDDPRIRRYLAMVLGSLGDRRATPLLSGATKEQDVETRIYALLALADLRDPASVPAVLEAAGDAEDDVRKAAIYALGSIGDARASQLLAEALADPKADIRFNAAVALSRMKDRRGLGTLREMLDRQRLDAVTGMREDQKEEAMIVAMSAYAHLAGVEAVPELNRLASDKSLRVQAAAKEALGKLRIEN